MFALGTRVFAALYPAAASEEHRAALRELRALNRGVTVAAAAVFLVGPLVVAVSERESWGLC